MKFLTTYWRAALCALFSFILLWANGIGLEAWQAQARGVFPAVKPFVTQAKSEKDTVNTFLKRAGPMGDHTMGSAKAPITVVEYVSFTCGHCAHFHDSIFPTLKKDYIDTGKVYYIYRSFPLDSLSLLASTYAQCLPKHAFFPYVKHLFESQREWIDPHDIPKSLSALKALTQQAGLKPKAMEACEHDKSVRNHLRFVYDNARDNLKVEGTPSFYVNGEAVSAADLLEKIEQRQQEQAAKSHKAS